MDEIRAEQTHIKHQPPHKCTHTQTHPHKVSGARWRRKFTENKREGERRKTEVEGKSQKRERRRNLGVQKKKKTAPRSYKQVKSEAVSLASQHRGW